MAYNKKDFLKTEKVVLEDLWLFIKMKRKEKKVSQKDLSEKTWIDRTFIVALENWKTNISYLNLLKIFDVLGVEIKFDEK